MCETSGKFDKKNGGFSINFNQDYTSLAIVSKAGYRIFTLSSVESVDEIFCSHNEETNIAERLFSSSLVSVVSTAEPNKLKICHFKKGTEICNYSYPTDILTVQLNRSRLIVCLANGIYIHNIRDMKLLHSIRNLAENTNGLCSLSLNSYLAYPASSSPTTVTGKGGSGGGSGSGGGGGNGGGGGGGSGELQIFDANSLVSKIKIKAHDSALSALNFSHNGILIATASEKGTVIRVFCIANGQKVHEFRRGVKRNVQIASLNFSSCVNYVCVSSNTETVHIFKIDQKLVESTERMSSIEQSPSPSAKTTSSTDTSSGSNTENEGGGVNESRWVMGFLAKTVVSYFPTHVSDVLTQDRAFAQVQLSQSGLRHECVITKLEKETRILVACEDGFLYIYDFDDDKGGDCRLIRVHDLRLALDGITEVNMSSTDGNLMMSGYSFDEDETKINVNDEPSKIQQSTQTINRKMTIGSYAGVLKGKNQDQMTDSEKFRDLNEAVDYPPKSSLQLFDDDQFPPVAVHVE